MNYDLQRLFNLLPALYRIRDNELGLKMLTEEEKRELEKLGANPDAKIQGPLKSLLAIIAEQIAVLEENLEQLYDDQFIETCAEWAVSYIGELVGTRELIYTPGSSVSRRGEIANTISYRRRKGTASLLEQLARDVTGWNANVVEYFQLLSTTQYMNHLRPHNLSIATLRNWEMLEFVNSPFDKMAHTVDVRRIEANRGKYNIQNIGVFLWRLNSYSLTKSPAYKVDERRFTFDPLGKDRQLYNLPLTEDTFTHLAGPDNVPMPISRRVLLNSLGTYYGKDKSILIYADGKAVLPFYSNLSSNPPVLSPPDAGPSSENVQDIISVCNLSDLLDSNGNVIGWANIPLEKIAIDPVLGRIAFPAADPPENVHVSFYYGFSAEMGGGEYGRAETFSSGLERVIEITSGSGTIQDALDQLAESGGVVEILDNEYYFETPVIRVAEGKTIELRAADKSRPVLVLENELLIEADENATVLINGLLICGGNIRLPVNKPGNQLNKLKTLRLLHCTLLPGPSPKFKELPALAVMPRIVVESADTIVDIEKTITGGLKVLGEARVFLHDSIVDAENESAVAYAGLSEGEPGGVLHIQNSTIIGKVHTRIMEMASNCIFMSGGMESADWPAPLIAQRLQQGCVRFSYIPAGSKLPRPYHCQPSALMHIARVRPLFTSLKFGEAGYCQLSRNCAVEITEGADDEAEMGAFHNLYQPQRKANLRTRLTEYLRFGLEVGIYDAS